MIEPSNVLSYAPDVDCRLVTYTNENEAVLNLSPLNRRRDTVVLAIVVLMAVGLIALTRSQQQGGFAVVQSSLLILFVGGMILAALVEAFAPPTVLRLHPDGFEYVRHGIRGHRRLDVRWHEVADVGLVIGPMMPLLKRRHSIRIELQNRDPYECVPLDLMPGRRLDEIQVVLGHLERWRQKAADAAAAGD